MEWFENEELAMITDTIRDFSDQEISGKVVDLDRPDKPEFPRGAIDKLSDLGFLWGPAPGNIGSGMDDITSVVILSKLAEASAGLAAIVATHHAALASVLAAPGGLSVLEGICGEGMPRGGLPLLGISLESDIVPVGGSDEGTCCRAIPAPDRFDRTVVFTGRGQDAKVRIANGLEISQYRVTGSGLSGCDEMPTLELVIPETTLAGLDVIAAGQDAIAAVDALMSSLKLNYSAVMQGAARSATAYALTYAGERCQTGRAIVHHQNVRKKLVEMEIKNQSMASFLYRAAFSSVDDGEFNLKDMLYAYVRTESEYVVNEAIQTLGGYGYMREYGLEKKLRDIKTLQALLPTTLSDWLGIRYAR